MPETKKNISEGYQPNRRNDGYQPQSTSKHHKDENNNYGFGYQPVKKQKESSQPPSPPTSGSNVVKDSK